MAVGSVRPVNPRNSAMVNGALIALGTLGIIDNVLFHWILQLHRAVPGPSAIVIELALVIVSFGVLLLEVLHELRERS
jgi:uncharacterized membrane protein